MKILKQTIKDRHGNQVTYEFDQPASSQEANGLMSSFKGLFGDHGIPKAEGIPHPGQAQGPDEVPAWLTPGEFVMNAEATRMFEPQIEAMNAAGQAQQQQQGGTIPEGSMIPEPVNPEIQQPIMRSTGGPVPLEATQPIDTLAELSKITGVPVETAMASEPVPVPGAHGPASSYNDVPTPENLPETTYTPEQLKAIRSIPMSDETLPGEGITSASDRDMKRANERYIVGLENDLQESIERGDNQTRQDVIRQSIKEARNAHGIPEQEASIPDPIVQAKTEIDNNTDTDEAKEEENNLIVTPDEELEDEGNKIKDENPAWYERVYDSLKEAANGLVDEGKLAEAAIVYLGSRALGYGHQGSLRYVGKGYLDRIAGDRKEIKDMHKGGQFTKDSVEAYKETGNRDASTLNRITKSTMKFDSTKAIDALVNGKKVKLSPAEVNGNKVFINQSGQVVHPGDREVAGPDGTTTKMSVVVDPYKISGTKEYNQRIQSNAQASVKQLKSLQEQFGTFGEGQDKGTITDMNANTNGRRVAEWAADNDVSPEEIGGLVEMAYKDMVNSARQSGKRPSDIKPFLNQLVVRNQVGSPELFLAKEQEGDAPTYVASHKLAVINTKVSDAMKAAGNKGNVRDITNQLYNLKADKWANELTDKERHRYSKLANDDENGFYVYVAESLGLDHRDK